MTVTPETYIRPDILIFTGVIHKEGNTSDSNTSDSNTRDIYKTWYTDLQGKEEVKWCVAKYGDPYLEFVLCF